MSVGDQDCGTWTGLNHGIQSRDPADCHGGVPVVLIHADKIGECVLPVRLPVIGA